jgi:hypothetical protein
MFRLVRNRDPSCARVSWTMKRLWCSGVVPSLNPEPAVSKASEVTAVQVRAFVGLAEQGVASSHGRGQRVARYTAESLPYGLGCSSFWPS